MPIMCLESGDITSFIYFVRFIIKVATFIIRCIAALHNQVMFAILKVGNVE